MLPQIWTSPQMKMHGFMKPIQAVSDLVGVLLDSDFYIPPYGISFQLYAL